MYPDASKLKRHEAIGNLDINQIFNDSKLLWLIFRCDNVIVVMLHFTKNLYFLDICTETFVDDISCLGLLPE